MDNDFRVLVSGASVAGLSVAFWLARYGFKVIVVERAPHLRPGGQALDVRGPALEVAERMGILADIRDRSTKQAGMSAVDSTGKEIFRSTERTLTGGRFDSPDVEILRDDLCSILYQAVDNEVEYIFDDSIALLSQNEDYIDVTFVNAAPDRFDLVIGADGVHSGVRRLAFGPEQQFIRYLGGYLAVFPVPNFLGLDRWQVLYMGRKIFGILLGLRKDIEARAYIAFNAEEPLDYDYRDETAQKRLIADRVAGAGWEFPRIVEHMWSVPNFHFDSMSQIRMDNWSRGRVVLVGDAGYCVSPQTGQGTTVAMVGAYVLAGELAAHRGDLLAGLHGYEEELRDYAIRNQDLALSSNSRSEASPGKTTGTEAVTSPDAVPDFGQLTQPIALKSY